MSFCKVELIAHRGLHHIKKGIPENSMAAFREALKLGLAIELDLHLLKDSSIVVFHDDSLDRMTGVSKRLRDCTYEEIKNLKLKNTEEKIPLFEDVLKLVHGSVLLDIELKSDAKLGFLEQAVAKILDDYPGHFYVKSFHPLIVNWFKKNRPNYTRGILVSDCRHEKLPLFIKKMLQHMAFNWLIRPEFIAYDIHIAHHKYYSKWRKKLPILIWNIRTIAELETAKKYGDCYICEGMLEDSVLKKSAGDEK